MKLSILVSIHLLCASLFINVANVSEIFSGLSPNLIKSIEETYTSSTSFKSLVDNLSAQNLQLEFINVKMQDVGYWYDVSSDGTQCIIYINQDIDFQIQDVSEVLFNIYTSLNRGSAYMQTRQSKIESMIYAELVTYECVGEPSLGMLYSSSEKKAAKYADKVRDLLFLGYDEERLNYLIVHSDIVPVFELNSTRFLKKTSLIKEPVIQNFLKSNHDTSSAR